MREDEKACEGVDAHTPFFRLSFLGSMKMKTRGIRLWRLPQLFFMSVQIVTKRISTILSIK